jgi:hypothetical protein
MKVHVELISTPTGVVAQKYLIDHLLGVRGLLVELSTDVDVGDSGVHSSSGYEAALDELVGVPTENVAVFARSGFAFVGVYD